MNKDRLLNVAIALEDAAKDQRLREAFTMGTFVRGIGDFCGTPACALGHYAARTDLQDVLAIHAVETLDHTDYRVAAADNCEVLPGWDEFDEDESCDAYKYDFDVAEHFGITGSECEELFGGDGCFNAQTPEAAAAYIRNFVEEHS